MANPILSGPDAFTRTEQWGAVPQFQTQAPVARMTIDDVIAKTAITMLTLMASAAASFMLLPASGLVMPALLVSSIVGLVTVFLVGARKRVNPALVLFYAVVEGVFIGAFSALFEASNPGIVSQAVIGTFVAAGVTLAGYTSGALRATPRVRRIVSLGTMAFFFVMLANFLLSLLHVDLGFRSGPIGVVAALVGAGLAVFNLVVDFDDIQGGINGGAPAVESWRAAFGLTVTMVWLYTEILRLLDYVRR